MRNPPWSAVVGRMVPLVEHDRPLLYLRSHNPADALEASKDFDLRGVALGHAPSFHLNKKRKITDFLVASLSTQPATTSNGGNAEEARHLRQVMGFEAPTPEAANSNSNFTFSFAPASTEETAAFSVFVGGMPYTWSTQQVQEFWSECGEVTHIDCMTFHDTGRFKGMAKITYKSEGGYKYALGCNGDTWEGFTFLVTPWKQKTLSEKTPAAATVAKEGPGCLGEKTEGFDVLFICNLPLSWTADDAATLFAGFEIEAVNLKTDLETGRSKGYAQIQFGCGDSRLEEAIAKLDRKEIEGRVVRVGYAVPPPNWRPKTKTARRTKLRAAEENATVEDYAIATGRYLVQLTGLRPTVTEDAVRELFSGVTLSNLVLLWSPRNRRYSGSAYLLLPDAAQLKTVLGMNGSFFQGRRLHMRPGRLSDYRKKAGPSKKKRKKGTAGAESVRDDDPLMALLQE